MRKVFNDFSEVESEVRAQVPSIIYKYRDWGNELHKVIIIENVIWFAHPKSLNDPFDIRIPHTYDFDEVNHPLFYERLKKYAEIYHKNVPPNSREFNIICENQLDLIKSNPQKWFEDRYREVRESELFDPIGLFSASINKIDQTMWAHYANNNKGICIGFDAVELVKELRVAFGIVIYQDEPLLYSFIEGRSITDNDEFMYKHSKWQHEKEFRLISFQMKQDFDRRVHFSRDLIKEIILGIDASNSTESEIIHLLKKEYDSKVKLFKLKASVTSFDFELNQIHY